MAWDNHFIEVLDADMDSSIEKYEEEIYVQIFGSKMDENNFEGALKLFLGLHVLTDMSHFKQGYKGRQLK